MEYQLIIDDIIGPWGFSKQFVRNELAKSKNKPCNVKISSLGGSLDDGLDIAQQFKDHGDVTCYIYGFTASAATVLAMGAKKICMGKYAMFLVHKCSNFVDAWGSYNSDQMQQLIEQLTENKKENDKVDVLLANLYADKCKKNVSEILDVLKEGKWLTAQEALNFGFIDEIVDDEKLNFSNDLKMKFNRIGLPISGIKISEENDKQTNLSEIVGSGIKSILEILKPKKENNGEINKSQNNMNKNTSLKVAKILGLEKFGEMEGDQIKLTEEELKIVENKLNDFDKDAESMKSASESQAKTISDLQAQIENLKKSPGETTQEIVDNGGIDNSYINESKKLFNSVKDII